MKNATANRKQSGSMWDKAIRLVLAISMLSCVTVPFSEVLPVAYGDEVVSEEAVAEDAAAPGTVEELAAPAESPADAWRGLYHGTTCGPPDPRPGAWTSAISL